MATKEEPKKEPQAQPAQTIKTVPVVPRPVMKECPSCRGARFQGPFQMGEIRDGVFFVTDTLYKCAGCGSMRPVEALKDRDQVQ